MVAGLALLKMLSSDPAYAENPALWKQGYHPESSNVTCAGWIRPYYPYWGPYSSFYYDSRGYRIYVNDGRNYIYFENRNPQGLQKTGSRVLSDYEAERVIEKYFEANDFDFERNVDVGPTIVDYVLHMKLISPEHDLITLNVAVEYLSPEEGGRSKKELLLKTPTKGVHYVLTIDKDDESGIRRHLDNGIKKIVEIVEKRLQ